MLCTKPSFQVRGKANDETRKPLTGCLVTANFDMKHTSKDFLCLKFEILRVNKEYLTKNTPYVNICISADCL